MPRLIKSKCCPCHTPDRSLSYRSPFPDRGKAMQSAEFYRQKAAEIREQADRARRRDIKEQFLEIAAQYDELAEQVENLQNKPEGYSGEVGQRPCRSSRTTLTWRYVSRRSGDRSLTLATVF